MERGMISYITSATVFFMLLMCLASCDKFSTYVHTTADVGIVIGLPGNLDIEEGPWTKAGDDYVDASQYEGVRTLRIIVTSGDPADRTILYNSKVTGLDDVAYYKTTIPDLPCEKLTFYAIANEESLGMTYNDETIKSNLADNHKLLFTDVTTPLHFPAKGPDIVKNGLPMSGYTTVELTGNRTVNIDLYRSVVKLALVVENATSEPVTLKKVDFGNFFGDMFYMFRDLTLDVPDDIKYTRMSYENLDIVIPGVSDDAAEPYTNTLSLYFYPTHPPFGANGSSPFTICVQTENNSYPTQVFAPNTSFFVRNTQVNLRARITTTVGITLDFNVAAWDDKPVEVPPFE